MYEELVKRLRNCATEASICNTCDLATDVFCRDTMMVQAANTIAELSKERKAGKNVATEYDDCDQFVCSECGIELQAWHRVERDEDDGDVTYHEYMFRFCPHCGAKMDDGSENQNWDKEEHTDV